MFLPSARRVVLVVQCDDIDEVSLNRPEVVTRFSVIWDSSDSP